MLKEHISKHQMALVVINKLLICSDNLKTTNKNAKHIRLFEKLTF